MDYRYKCTCLAHPETSKAIERGLWKGEDSSGRHERSLNGSHSSWLLLLLLWMLIRGGSLGG